MPGRWSRPYRVVLIVLAIATIAAGRHAIRWSGLDHRPHGDLAARAWFDIGLFTLGLGQGILALVDPSEVGRLASLTSTAPVGLASRARVDRHDPPDGIGRVPGGAPNDAPGVGEPGPRRDVCSRAGFAGGGLVASSDLSPSVGGRFRTVSNAGWLHPHVRYNREGRRDIGHAENPGAARRFLVNGDSFAIGWGLEDTADRFSEQLAGCATARTWSRCSMGPTIWTISPRPSGLLFWKERDLSGEGRQVARVLFRWDPGGRCGCGAPLSDVIRLFREAGSPVLPIDRTFAGFSFDSLTINRKDRHPNQPALRLAAAATAGMLGPMIPPERPSCAR